MARMEVFMGRVRYPWRIGSLNTGQLFIDFANSEWYDGRGNLTDRLRDTPWRRAFLEEWGLDRYGPIDRLALRELTKLRSAIRSIADRLHAGRRPTQDDLEHLNEVLAAYPVRFRVSLGGGKHQLELDPLTGRSSRIIAWEIALSAAQFLAGGELDRLKMCDNPRCLWMFYDETKNRGRRWCGPCGNVDKVRRFRERHRLASGR
jgi:predicted RNA-binding Zn ribbon-like protein